MTVQRKPRRAQGTGMEPIWNPRRQAWRIDLDWGRKPTGERWRPSVYHEDKATCIKNAKAKQKEHEAEVGETRPGSKSMTLTGLYQGLEEHLDTLIDSDHLKETTKRGKLHKIRNHVLPGHEQMRVVDVLPSTVERWLRNAKNTRTGQPLPTGTKRKIWEAINDLFDVAVRDQIILAKDHPSRQVKGPRAPRRKVEEWYTPDQAELIIKAAPGTTKTGVVILWTSTARQITMRHIRWRNVNFETGKIYPEITKRKSGDTRPPGVITMNATLIRHLRSLGEHHPDEFVVPHEDDPFRPRPAMSFTASFKRACEKAGVPYLSAHKLRHGGVTRLLQAGKDAETIREILDWSSVAMLDVYAHTDAASVSDGMTALDLGEDEFGDNCRICGKPLDAPGLTAHPNCDLPN